MPFAWICKANFWSRTYSTIDEVVEIFDENWFDKIDVSRVKIRQSSVEIPKSSAVLCRQFLVVFRNVLQYKFNFTKTAQFTKYFKKNIFLPFSTHPTCYRYTAGVLGR